MPDYSTSAPPQSLQPGGVFYSFGNIIYPGPSVPSDRPPFTTGDPTQEEVPEPIPAAPQAGQRCALTQPVPAFDSGGRAITYEAEFNSAPTTASISLQGAMRDVDAEYVTLSSMDAITALRGSLTVLGVRQLFLRLHLDSITPLDATTVIGKILG